MFTIPSYAAQRLEPLATFFTNSGAVASSYLLYTYKPGTTTKKATYSDYNLATEHDNPIVLNYAGRPAGDAPIYFTGAIKYVLKNAGGGLIYTVDNYSNSANINTYFYMSDYDHINDLDDACNAYTGGACAAVLNDDDTMDASASFDSDVTVIGVPGNTITATGFTLTISGMFIEYADTVTGGTVNRNGGLLRIQSTGPKVILNDTDGADGFYSLAATDANDSIFTFGVDDSNGDDQSYLLLNGVNEDIELEYPLILGTWMTRDTTAETTGGAITLEAADLLGGVIDSDPGGAVAWTFDTAANIVAAISDAEVGYSFTCWLHNDGSNGVGEVVTLTAAAGVTLHGSTATLTEGTNETALLLIRLTNVTAASEAVDVYILTGI